MSSFRFGLLALAVVLSTSNLLAQVPNGGFENWTDGEPDGWLTSNVPGFAVPVTRSTDRHSGSFAVRGEVVSAFGFPLPPTITSIENDSTSGFPISQRWASVTGWYKFDAVQDDQLAVIVIMTDANADTAVGGGSAVLPAASTFSGFSVPVIYFSGTVPTRCIIQVTVFPPDSGSLAHLGSSYIVDDLALSGVSAVDPMPAPLPTVARLTQNFPNPFNPTTTFEFQLPESGPATLEVFDMLGQRVATVLDEAVQAGTYRLAFDAAELPSGTYLYRLRAGDFVQTRTMVLLK